MVQDKKELSEWVELPPDIAPSGAAIDPHWIVEAEVGGEGVVEAIPEKLEDERYDLPRE